MNETIAIAPTVSVAAPPANAAAQALKAMQRRELIAWHELDDGKDGRANVLAKLTNRVISSLQELAAEMHVRFSFRDDHIGWVLLLPRSRFPNVRSIDIVLSRASGDGQEVELTVTSNPRSRGKNPTSRELRVPTSDMVQTLKASDYFFQYLNV